MNLKAYTSRSRFDEARRFTGVYQQMGRQCLDADWSEEVRLRTVDAQRRTADVADGSPDDGFRIVGDHLIDPIGSIFGWRGAGLALDDERIIPPELRLDRHSPEALPWVIRTRGHIAVRRTLPAPLDLRQLLRNDGSTYSATELVFSLRFDRPPTDDEIIDVQVLLIDDEGEHAVSAGLGQDPNGWRDVRVPVTAFEAQGADLTRVSGWGVRGLPPMARCYIAGLRAVDPALGDDVIIRGGDGSLVGAGRLLVNGVRVFQERDLRYAAQPDFPGAPPLAPLPTDGSRHHFLYLDVSELTVTALDDPFLLEEALDGQDTTARLRLVAQVRAVQSLGAGDAEPLPASTGGGRLTTNIPAGALPDRRPPEPFDPCRDRCLFTENASTQEGYTGSDNLHCRVEVFRGGENPVVLWSRDNGSVLLPLVADVAPDALSVQMSPENARKLRAGDLVVLEDRANRLRYDNPAAPVLRRVQGVQAETGWVELTPAPDLLTEDPVALPVGGPVGRTFTVPEGAALRRWDGGDLLMTGVRYRLQDGITFAFSGDGFRAQDAWTFTVRVRAPDGAARGVVEQLTDAPVQGPVHHYVPLARVRGGERRTFEDLRPRYLPLAQVRDRLIELGARTVGPAVFTVVIGDGVRTFGDIDQDRIAGVTADEALQAAADLLGAEGGSIYIRAGSYRLEHPVLLRGMSALTILGDADATELRCQGAGGALYLDRCGHAGAVRIRDLKLVEATAEEVEIGTPDPVRRPLVFGEGVRLAPLPEAPERVISPEDVLRPASFAPFLRVVGERLRVLQPGEGRAAGSVAATFMALRRLQRANPGQELEDVAEAAPLLEALDALPHGVVTIADSSSVTLERCTIEVLDRGPQATGVLVTGTCARLKIRDNRILAQSGIGALPYAPSFTDRFLAAFPRAGLFVDGLSIRGNDLTANGAAPTWGIHVADGALASVVISENRVRGFHVGLRLHDRAEAQGSAPVARILVGSNQVFDSRAVGIQVEADGVDVDGNELRNTASDGLFQAGIQVAGRAIRVRDSWVQIPAAPATPVLGVLAGIVVGDGMDDGLGGERAVFDVELSDNRIEGAGELSPAVGILIGGPQAIYDVRIRGNALRALGDSGVRAHGGGGPIGRIRIEGNRFEQVALADVPAEADNAAALERLNSTVADALEQNALSRPRPLIEALLAHASNNMRAPLDAALRWVERLSLRGAITLAGVEEGWVCQNRIIETGRSEPYAQPPFEGEIRAAAVGIVGGRDVTVEGNEIRQVRAPIRRTTTEPRPSTPRLPAIMGVLDRLGVTADTSPLDRADVHAAIVGLRSLVLNYTAEDDDGRQKLGRAIYGALDALSRDLIDLGGTPARLGETLKEEIAELRAAQGRRDHTHSSNAVRSTLSQAASATGLSPLSQDAWDSAAQFDLAMTGSTDAVRAATQRLTSALGALTSGLPEATRSELQEALGRAEGAPSRLEAQVLVARALGNVAALRDAQAQRDRNPPIGEVIGSTRTIVRTFAESALRALPQASTESRTRGRTRSTATEGLNEKVLINLRQSKEALTAQLRNTDPALAIQLETDFRNVDRSRGESPAAVERLRSTLRKVNDFASGTAPAIELEPSDAERTTTQGVNASISLFATSLDQQVSSLVAASDDTAEKQLRAFGGTLSQLVNLVDGDPELAPLAAEANQAINAALKQPDERTRHLSTARTFFHQIRTRVTDLLPPKIFLPPRPPIPTSLDRRTAALGALVLAIEGEPDANRQTMLAAYRSHLVRALDLVGLQGSRREQTLRAVDEAAGALQRGARGRRGAEALHRLIFEAAELAATSETSAPGLEIPGALQAAATTLRVAEQALDPAEEAAARVARVHGYLRQRPQRLSASLVATLLGTQSLEEILQQARSALDRLARGESPDTGEVTDPVYTTFAAPADGVFTAGVTSRIRLSGNSVQESVTGLTVLGAAGHVLTEVPPQSGVQIDITGNRLMGCAVAGLEVRPDLQAVAIVTDNHLFACAGIAAAGLPNIGQAVATFAGSGELVLQGNVSQESGNTLAHAMLHELAIDWRGDLVVRGNTVRHRGGGGGGAGVLILTEAVPAELVQKLVRVPFLATEPPPRPAGVGRPKFSPNLTFTPSLTLPPAIAGALVTESRPEDLLELGGLKQRLASAPVLNSALVVTRATLPPPSMATEMADRLVSPAQRIQPFLSFLARPFPLLPSFRVRPRVGTVLLEGNDIEARGPALLLLSEGNDLLSASVVGNELRSHGSEGAVYLRRTDATVFSSNRCECLSTVNVVVVRAGKAPVTLQGNVIVGAEPVTPRVPPVRPPVLTAPGNLTLNVPVGAGSVLAVPVSSKVLLGNLERRRDVARDTFATLLSQAVTATPEPAPAPEEEANPAFARPTRTEVDVTRARVRSSAVLDAATVSEVSGRLPAGMETRLGARTIYGTARVEDDSPTTNLRNLVDRVALHAPQEQVESHVRAVLASADGDPKKALQMVDKSLLGIETAPPAVKESITHASLLHEVLADILSADPTTQPADGIQGELQLPPRPPEPEPYAFSMVVIGGSRVSAVGNAATAGVHVQEADSVVQLNP